jgi:predicted transcriptional regulator of viral defense system
MESLNKLQIIRTLQSHHISFITPKDFQRIFSIQNTNTAYKALQRLYEGNVLERIKDGLYMVKNSGLHDFTIANTLINPSYVSLESALSRYGILSQFPFIVTSITLKKSREIQYGKAYEYTKVASSLYFGFQKESGYLIANPEKALLDMIYLCSKGLRKIDFTDLDYTSVNKKLFSVYCKKIVNAQFKGYIKQNVHI